jgi:hypothetical protein
MASYSSSFTTANEDPISEGGNWSTGYTAFGNVQIVSNAARASVVNSDGMASHVGALTDNQLIQFTIKTLTGSGRYFNICARWTAPATVTGYNHYGNSGTEDVLAKKVAGVHTPLAVVTASPAWAAGDTIGIYPDGSFIRGYKNGVVTVSATDTSAASGRGGMIIFVPTGGSLADLEIDDYQSEDAVVPAGPTTAPSLNCWMGGYW